MKTAPPHEPTTPSRQPAFTRPRDVASVPVKGLSVTIEPVASDYPAIAAQCGVPAVASLRVTYKVMPRAGGRYEVIGDLKARATQVCVVSLEPFESDLTGEIDLTFAPTPAVLDQWFEIEAPRRGRRGEPEKVARPPREASPSPVNEDQPDPPDPIVDGRIDLGAIALEFLVLALDPYPRKPGVAFDGVAGGDDPPEPTAFAGLARLRDRS